MITELLNRPYEAVRKSLYYGVEAHKKAQEKAEFLSIYAPIRKSIEEFLRQGQKIEVTPLQAAIANLMDRVSELPASPLVPSLRPYWKNEIRVPKSESYPPLVIRAETDRGTYVDFIKNSGSIEDAAIILTVHIPLNSNGGAVAVLPPLAAFQDDIYPFEKWRSHIENVREVLPFLNQTPQEPKE